MAEYERAQERRPRRKTQIWLNGDYVGSYGNVSGERMAAYLKERKAKKITPAEREEWQRKVEAGIAR